MASETYPKIPTKAWATLRSRASSAPSSKFSAKTVAALLGMSSPTSAQANVVRALQVMGLVETDGTLTALGNKWRVDGTYGEACQEILSTVYPSDLASLTNEDGTPDAQAVRNWFAHQGFGESNVQQMSGTYLLLASKEIPGTAPEAKSQPKAKGETKGAAKTTQPRRVLRGIASKTPQTDNAIPREGGSGPSIHLDIQVHIPATATPEQIDQIFSSIAKHLNGR